MATYGNFETVGRIYSIGARSVWSARREGKGKDEYVVKVLDPDGVFGEDPGVVVAEFTQRATIQRKLTDAGSRHWAAVHEIGTRDGEVYYVTDRAAGSAQQLVAGKVRTEGADLYRVVSRVVEALRELREGAGRAHGNLKPSNVLIDRTGDIALAGVLLTDPSGAPQPNAAAAETGDVRDLGDLIHQLVLHAPFRAMGGYPIEDSPGWARLGKHGQRWRALVNRMLDPAAAPGSLSIESVAGEVAGLKAKAAGGPRPAILAGAAVGLVALLAGAAVVALPMLRGGGGGGGRVVEERFDARAWEEWCDKAGWAIAMQDALRTTSRRADIERDEYLRGVLIPLMESQVEIQPTKVDDLNLAMRQLPTLKAEPPPQARSAVGVRETAAALEWIHALESAFTPGQWEAVRRMQEAGARASELRWEQLSKDAAGLVERVSAVDGQDPRDVLAAAVEISAKAPAYARLLDAIARRDPDPDSPQVGTYRRLVSDNFGIYDAVEVAHIESLTAYLNDPANVVQEPAPEIDPVDPDPVEPDRVETLAPDPREGWDVPAQLAALRAGLDEAWVSELEGGSVERAARARNDAQALGDLLESIRSRDWSPETSEQVTQDMGAAGGRIELLAAAVTQLRQEHNALVEARRSAENEAALAASQHRAAVLNLQEQAPPDTGSPFLDAQWTSMRDGIIEQYADPADLSDLQDAATQLREALIGARNGIPMPALPEAGPRGYDARALALVFEGLREQALARAWEAGRAGGFGTAFQAALSDESSALATQAETARRFAADMVLAEFGLGIAAGWEEALPRTSPPETLAAIAARWAAAPPPGPVMAAMGPIPGELAAVAGLVRSLESAGAAPPAQRELYEEMVADGNFPLITRLYTWRALAPHPGVSLPAEQEMLTALRAAIASLPEARQSALRAELEQAALRRWTAAIEGAQSRSEYEAAWAARSIVEGGVNPEALTPRTQFNLGLIRAVERLENLPAGATDDQVRAVLKLIVDAADASQTPWQSDTGTTAWIEAVRAAYNQTGGMDVNVLAERGPGARGWAFSPVDPQGGRVQYTRDTGSGTLLLEFVRLDPGSDAVGQSVYIATTEVSVGLFGAAANRADAWGPITTAWGERLTNPDESWNGPRVWGFNPSSPNRLVLNDRWLAVEGSGSFRIPRPFAAAPERRSLDMPVQYITPLAASLFARELGCRLPSSAEWAAARARETGTAWNLRDEAWRAQQTAAAANQRGPAIWPFPDDGAFVPMGREVPSGADATSVSGLNDGTLYFQPVDAGAGSTFRHIVGNVAEFVDDSPAGFAGGDDARTYRVIGGSALSAPELGVTEALPIVTNPRLNHLVATSNFPDVGFRLAFDAGVLGAGPPLAQQAPELARTLSLMRP